VSDQLLTVGSLFSGYGGLDLAVEDVFPDAQMLWVSDICKVNKDGSVGHHTPHRGPCAILQHRFPGVPNLGDIASIDWTQVPKPTILTLGFPCQDLSSAGKQLGLRPGTRSGLWSHAAYAISQLRPQLVIIENVRGLLSAQAHSDVEPCPWCMGDEPGEPALRALGAVLGDLADLGYDAEWVGLRAADVSASHGRFRVFVAAWPANARSE
jgi:DNA (cytosine-5)-methyltransferase 1